MLPGLGPSVIRAIPENLTRHISAASDIYDTKTVLKELIDNAIDARATSVTIELSVDTLEVIQVRDNGTGITPGDRLAIARRHFTSKIRDLDDLRRIGGSSLGFRGVALSSIAAMSGAMTVTTRVEGEDVAAKLHISRSGEVVKDETVSGGNGTTVRVTDYLKNSPVRKKVATGQATTTLANIRRLLQAYAVARPAIRLSLRVLKAKSDKFNFIYAPRPGAGPEDAVIKAVGRLVGSQCAWSVWEANGYELRACLPRVDAEPAKISGYGSFISIDSRPVSAVKNNIKAIELLFKQRFRVVYRAHESVSRPFFCLDVRCPVESYDVNIEPAKDDILFYEKQSLLLAVEGLLDAAYPESSPHVSTTSPALQAISTTNAEVSFGSRQPVDITSPLLSLEKKDSLTASGLSPTSSNVSNEDFRGNMYDLIDLNVTDSLTEAEQPTLSAEPGGEDFFRNNGTVSNPWTLAKINGRNRKHQRVLRDIQQPSPPPSDPIISPRLQGQLDGSPTRLRRHLQRLKRTLPREESYLITSGPQCLNDVLQAEIWGPKISRVAPVSHHTRGSVQDLISGASEQTSTCHGRRNRPSPDGNLSTATGHRIVPFEAAAVPRLRHTSKQAPHMKQVKLNFGPKNTRALSDSNDRRLSDQPVISQDFLFSSPRTEGMSGGLAQPQPACTAPPFNCNRQSGTAETPQESYLGESGGQTSAPAFETLRPASVGSKPLRTASKSAGRTYRTRSAGLPLECVPAAAAMQNVIVTVDLSLKDFAGLMETHARVVDEETPFISNSNEAKLHLWVTRVVNGLNKTKVGRVAYDDILAQLRVTVTNLDGI